MEDIDQILDDFSALPEEYNGAIGNKSLVRIVQILCKEVVRLRAVERNNGPVIRRAELYTMRF